MNYCMAQVVPSFLWPSSSSSRFLSCRITRVSAAASSSSNMEEQHQNQIGRQKLMEYPYLCTSHRDLMVDLVTAMEARVGSQQLLPCSVPEDVQFYQNDSGTSQGTLHIRCGDDSSHIDFMLASWLHLSLPNGGAMDITNLQGYLKTSSDAPHFQFELVQCSPTYFILFIDFTPRKDLVLHSNYLETFYEATQLEEQRLKLGIVPEIKPYVPSSLYFRRVISPTGIMVSIECEASQPERAEEIIRDHVSHVAKEVFEIWVDKCVYGGGLVKVEEAEKSVLKTRDGLIKSRAVEMDLSQNLPKQFGQQVADRVLRVIKHVFKINT